MGGRAGRLVQAAARLPLPARCRALAVVRDGASQTPDAIPRLQPDDLVAVAGPAQTLYMADRLFQVRGARRGTALVVGGGALGRNVASELVPIMDRVTLAERRAAVCESLAESLDGVRIAHGDGTNLGFLEELDTRHARTFVATTHEDEVNLMGTLLSKRLGVERTIALLHRPDYAEVFSALGIDSTVSPRLLVSREVLRFVRRQSGTLQSRIPSDGSTVFEMQIGADSPLAGRRPFDLDLPHGAVVAAVTRDRDLVEEPELAALTPGDVLVLYAQERAVAAARRTLVRG